MITEGVISPLNKAIFGENFKVVEFLIGNGANVNMVDDKNWTPLNYAISKGQNDIIKKLLQTCTKRAIVLL